MRFTRRSPSASARSRSSFAARKAAISIRAAISPRKTAIMRAWDQGRLLATCCRGTKKSGILTETFMSRPEPIEEPSAAIEALLNYLIDTGDKPASYGGVSSAEAEQKRKGKYQEYKMIVRDGRAIANQLSLEREGFIF